ncbi:MAG: TetR/AcrR family transcriptional regulator [Myxococcaceae bacterium]|nr:TetR/AcrR family transcriptional regulator [Myxococcaceae bacterium]
MARPADPNAQGALIAAARKEFVRAGVKGARIEDITHACGLSKGAFYLHFDSKEELFGQVVGEFMALVQKRVKAREEDITAFFMRNGPLREQDVRKKSARHEAFLALEVKHDRGLLETIWNYRDIFDVLMRGSQGTAFDGLVWEMVQREIERIKDSFEIFKQYGACRTDVPSEIFGSLVVGTYLLVAKQMSLLQAPPNFDLWVESLHRLIREGSAPPLQPQRQAKARRAGGKVTMQRRNKRSRP